MVGSCRLQCLARVLERPGVTWALLVLQVPVLVLLGWAARPWMTGDSAHYLELADNIVAGRGFGSEFRGVFQPEAFRMPGYPLFLALLRGLFPGATLPIVAVQGGLYIGTLGLTVAVTERVLGRASAAILALLAAGHPFAAYSAMQISPELPTFCLVSATLLCIRTGSVRSFAVGGLMLAAATWFRPNIVLLPGALILSAIWLRPRMAARAVALLLVFFAGMAPLSIRNFVLFRSLSPTPVVDAAAHSLYIATWQDELPMRAIIRYGMTGAADPEMHSSGFLSEVASINARVGAPLETGIFPQSYPGNAQKIAVSREVRRTAFARIARAPRLLLRHAAMNSIRMWLPMHPPRQFDTILSRYAVLGSGVALLLCGTLGMITAIRTERGELQALAVASALTAAYFTVTLCWLHTEARYTVPARLVLLIFASYGVARFLRAPRTPATSGAARVGPEGSKPSTDSIPLRRFPASDLAFGRGATTIPVGTAAQVRKSSSTRALLDPDLLGRRRRFSAWIFTPLVSRLRFVHAVSEATASAIEACEAAWTFYRGVFKVVIVDNSKVVVQDPDPLAPELNLGLRGYSQPRSW